MNNENYEDKAIVNLNNEELLDSIVKVNHVLSYSLFELFHLTLRFKLPYITNKEHLNVQMMYDFLKKSATIILAGNVFKTVLSTKN